ncbi:MAG: class I SAM-dependent methyltransferase [Novosphingobium sp.]
MQRYRPFICPFEDLIGEVPAGASMLDIGCGSGLFLGLLAASGHSFSGTGVDISRDGISLAEQMAGRLTASGSNADLRFIHLAAGNAWPSERFGVTAMIDVLHHVAPAEQEETIRRACRVTALGGTLLYKDMCGDSTWRAAANRLHDLILARQWIHYVPPARVEHWAREEGFELVLSQRSNRMWYGHDLRVFRCRRAA